MGNDVVLLRGVGAAGWNLSVLEVIESTNDFARQLPAWSAVRADRQTAGRGRFGRTFVSDVGGLWLSAVLPVTGAPELWNGFSLMVGCHLLRMLKALANPDARLRWPNDLMVGSKKLGGLLIEQSGQGQLIVGLGLNVRNEPWAEDPALASTTTRLADWSNHPPELDALSSHVLDALANAHEAMLRQGLSAAVAEFNSQQKPCSVELLLTDGSSARGIFDGLDEKGNLLLSDVAQQRTIEHQLVQRLREID